MAESKWERWLALFAFSPWMRKFDVPGYNRESCSALLRVVVYACAYQQGDRGSVLIQLCTWYLLKSLSYGCGTGFPNAPGFMTLCRSLRWLYRALTWLRICCVKCIVSIVYLQSFGFQTKNVWLIKTWIRVNVCKTSKNIPVPENSSDLSKSGLIRVRLIKTHLFCNFSHQLPKWCHCIISLICTLFSQLCISFVRNVPTFIMNAIEFVEAGISDRPQ